MLPKDQLIKVHQDLTIQELFRAYKYSKNRSNGNQSKLYSRPFLANIISLFLTRKYIWGELPPQTEFYWEVYNPSRGDAKGIKFDNILRERGVEPKYLSNTNSEYLPNLLRTDPNLNMKLDSFKESIMEQLKSPITYLEHQHFISTNFSMRIPDPESKLMIDGKYIGISYFDIPFYVLNPLVGAHYIGISDPIILDHKFSKNKDTSTTSDIQIEDLEEKHIVESSMLQLVLDLGDPKYLIGEPTYIR
jgi:hypothetical protein